MKGISSQTTFIRSNAVKELRVFSFIELEVRQKLSEHIIPMKFNKGDVIIRKGIKETIYIITQGKVIKQSSNNSKVPLNKEFKKGRILGFSTMLNETSLHDTFICDTDVECFNISGDTIRTVFGRDKFSSTIIRLFLEDVLEEKRISSNNNSGSSSYYDEDAK
mmetsp:Transcript_9148/g.8761  ORF Transcript_9148/g.8761 Transcript_9148/m.8761 type:complete len:163 (-) Transcript_9148:1204-1692(-)